MRNTSLWRHIIGDWLEWLARTMLILKKLIMAQTRVSTEAWIIHGCCLPKDAGFTSGYGSLALCWLSIALQSTSYFFEVGLEQSCQCEFRPVTCRCLVRTRWINKLVTTVWRNTEGQCTPCRKHEQICLANADDCGWHFMILSTLHETFRLKVAGFGKLVALHGSLFWAIHLLLGFGVATIAPRLLVNVLFGSCGQSPERRWSERLCFGYAWNVPLCAASVVCLGGVRVELPTETGWTELIPRLWLESKGLGSSLGRPWWQSNRRVRRHRGCHCSKCIKDK